jgi:hypothetical protein
VAIHDAVQLPVADQLAIINAKTLLAQAEAAASREAAAAADKAAVASREAAAASREAAAAADQRSLAADKEVVSSREAAAAAEKAAAVTEKRALTADKELAVEVAKRQRLADERDLALATPRTTSGVGALCMPMQRVLMQVQILCRWPPRSLAWTAPRMCSCVT